MVEDAFYFYSVKCLRITLFFPNSLRDLFCQQKIISQVLINRAWFDISSFPNKSVGTSFTIYCKNDILIVRQLNNISLRVLLAKQSCRKGIFNTECYPISYPGAESELCPLAEQKFSTFIFHLHFPRPRRNDKIATNKCPDIPRITSIQRAGVVYYTYILCRPSKQQSSGHLPSLPGYLLTHRTDSNPPSPT